MTLHEEAPSLLNFALPGEELPEDTIRLALYFHTDSVVMQTFGPGPLQSVKLVSARDVAMALSRQLSMGSGLLPRDALWWQNTRDGARIAIYQPPKTWRVAVQLSQGAPAERFTVPMPGLVFVCNTTGTPPWVVAVKRRPQQPTDPTWRAPCFNVFENTGVCAGNHKFPVNPAEVPESFFTSFFTYELGGKRSQKHDKLIALWRDLDGRRQYPLDDLVQQGTVKDLMDLS